MTPVWVNAILDPNGHFFRLDISSPQNCLHLAQYIDIIEAWLSATKKEHEKHIKEFQDLQKSGKLVSISTWKKNQNGGP